MGKHPIDPKIKEQITAFRKQGFSIPEMHRILSVSKSTVLRYSKDVEILPEYHQRWLDRRNASKIIAERRQVVARSKAQELVPNISNESLTLVATALYWAEGAKRDFSITNSDPELIKVFVKILHKIFEIKYEDLKISIRLYQDLTVNEAINFWSEVVGVELKLGVNLSINILNGKKQGKLKYGMCRVRVRKGGLLLKTIFAINKRVCEVISS